MSQYITYNGNKVVQLDDGALVPVNVTLSLDGGTLVKLSDAQVASLRSVILPNVYPLPDNQVSALQQATVSNFPSGFNVNNFPSGFNVSNLPSAYPLPTAQETMLSGLNTFVTNLDKGSGNYGPNTLRVTIVPNQPIVPVSLPYVKMAPIALTNSGDNTIVSPSSGTKGLRIAAIAFTAPSAVSVVFNEGTIGQGQTALSGAMQIVDYSESFARVLAISTGKSFVMTIGASVPVNGYIQYWEE